MNIDKIEFEAYMERLMDRFDILDDKLDRMQRIKNCIEGEELMDNQDVLQALKISSRSLQRIRTSGQLPYYTIHGKIYYKLTEVNRFIREIFNADSRRYAKVSQVTPRKAR